MKVKLTETYDRLTLSVKDGESSVNMTISRRGETISGRGMSPADMKKVMNKFVAYLGTKASYGDRMNSLKAVAEKSSSLSDFLMGSW